MLNIIKFCVNVQSANMVTDITLSFFMLNVILLIVKLFSINMPSVIYQYLWQHEYLVHDSCCCVGCDIHGDIVLLQVVEVIVIEARLKIFFAHSFKC
jgi:hypothetical protein